MNYQLHTFGCKVNTYDAGLIQKNLQQHGFQLQQKSGAGGSKSGEVHVLNTCAVTAEATKEAVRVIRRIKSKDPLATIVVTGCAAQVDTGAFSELPSVNLVVANSHKGLLPFILDQYFKGENTERVYKSNIFRKEDLEAGGGIEEKHSRAFLKIQDGCNSFCSYCIIPYARGKSRSIGIRDLTQRVNELYELGFREVVLTGVHIGDYEDTQISAAAPRRLEDLVETLLTKTSIPRFRLSSLEPVEVSDRLLQIYQDPRMCPHFHMSIQSAESSVLRQMKRNYSQAEVISSLAKIRDQVKNAFVGMDVITGFPTETEEMFEETYRVLSETAWTKLHVFPYSERQGTRAAQMSMSGEHSVEMSVRKVRAGKLRDLSRHRMQAEALKQVGTLKKLIVLKETKNPASRSGVSAASRSGVSAASRSGVSRDFWNVKLRSTEEEIQRLLDPVTQELLVEIEALDMTSLDVGDTRLVARPVQGGIV